MAINRLVAPSVPPTENADWTRMKAIVDALLLHQEQPLRVVGSSVVKGALFQIGGTVYLADADTAITGTPSDYVKILPSGDGSTCSAAFVASLTGVAWNSTYNGYYDSGSPASLYIFDEGKAYTAEQIAAIMNTKNQVIELGAGWLATLANALGTDWPAALGAAYTEPADRAAADALKQNLPSGSDNVNEREFTPGTVLLAQSAGYRNRNVAVNVYLYGSNSYRYSLDSGTLLNGNWAASGCVFNALEEYYAILVQRIS